MNIRDRYDRIYQFMKHTSYTIFFIVYIVLSCIIMILLGASLELLPDKSYKIWEIILRFIIGLPLLLQLLLTYIVYLKNRNKRIIMGLVIVTVLYTIVCAILSLYDLYFTYPSFGDDLLFGVLFAQLLFQIALIVALVICMFFKLVSKKVIVKSVIILILSAALIILSNVPIYFGNNVELIIILIGCYNPVLLFILSNIAKDKVFKTTDM